MNQEIKSKLEQAAETAWEQDQKTNPSPVNPHAYVYGYKAGAETILENPGEWGLVEKRLVDAGIQLRIGTVKACEEVHSRNEKYRGALEAIKSECDPNNPTHEKFWRIAFNATKEALKQH